jgi:putative DNA primase/helicase
METTGKLNASAPWEAGRGDDRLAVTDSHPEYSTTTSVLQAPILSDRQGRGGGMNATRYSPNLASIPDELKALTQWVCWRAEPDDSGRMTKVPYKTSGRSKAKSNEPTTWGTFEQAVSHWRANDWVTGIGICFDGKLIGIDLDHCIEGGALAPWAAGILRDLATYAERSPSGSGVHLLAWGELPDGRRNVKLPELGEGCAIEMYGAGSPKFFTVTGDAIAGYEKVQRRPAELQAVHDKFMQPKQERAKAKQRSPGSQATGPALTMADADLLTKARTAKNGAKFDRLFDGNTTDYGGDESAADLALCNLLSFWTDDAGQIDRLFRASKLMRPKWDQKHAGDGSTYGRMTVDKARDPGRERYTPHVNGRTAALRSTRARQAAPPQPPEDEESETPPAASEHLTDLGNARRLAARHGQDLRFCNPWGQWLAWDTMHWAPDDTQEAVRRAKATVASIYAEAAGADEDGRKAIAKHAMRSEGGQRIREMLKLAESEPGIPILPGDLDADPWLFNVLNGTLDLRTGQLREHRRGDMLTKMSPVFYEPDADCPTWLAFLERIMAGDQDLIAYLQRVIGYSLTGDTSEQALFVFHGTGANGKSTLLEAIHEMLGQDYALRIRTETLMVKQGDAVPSDIARLRGARLVSAQETEEGKRLAESLVKSLTGGDTVTARFMRQNEFQFKPEFKLFVASNHKPTIRGTDYAMWRRIRLVPFTVTIPEAEQDRRLCNKLRTELSGILAWAVRGCLAWQREGLGLPAAVRSATDTYRAESDILAAFLEERTTKAPEVAAGQLYEAYKTWAESNGEHAMTGQMFGRRLAERGVDKYRKGSLTFYLGLGLLA